MPNGRFAFNNSRSGASTPYIDVVADGYAVVMDMSMKIAYFIIASEQQWIMGQIVLLMIEFYDDTYIIKSETLLFFIFPRIMLFQIVEKARLS